MIALVASTDYVDIEDLAMGLRLREYFPAPHQLRVVVANVGLGRSRSVAMSLLQSQLSRRNLSFAVDPRFLAGSPKRAVRIRI